MGKFDEARKELEAVLSVAPDNLAAIRALAGIHEHLGVAELSGLVAAMNAGTGSPVSAGIVEAPAAADPAVIAPPPLVTSPVVQHTDPALPALEQWLAAIVADRAYSR